MVNIRGVEPSDVGSEQFGAWGGVTNPPLTHTHSHTHTLTLTFLLLPQKLSSHQAYTLRTQEANTHRRQLLTKERHYTDYPAMASTTGTKQTEH